MAAAQMALPVDRRNGASAHPALPRTAPPAVEATPVVEAVPEVGPAVDQVPDVGPAPVPGWVQRVTTAAVLSVALVAAVASYESPYVKEWVG
jgi:hypothetical protein